MNFLSHYYFERYSHDPELVLGSVLPDLIRNADRSVTILPQKYEDRFGNNPKMQSIYRGWARHTETDRYFHNSDFFYTHTHELKILLAPTVEGTEIRPSFLSHIGLELLLDHLLLHNNRIHEADFYEYLAMADRDTVHRFLSLCAVKDTAFFFDYFDNFLKARYVGEYRDHRNLVTAMINICRRLWDVSPVQTKQEQMVAAIADYAAALDGHFRGIFDDIRAQLLLLH